MHLERAFPEASAVQGDQTVGAPSSIASRALRPARMLCSAVRGGDGRHGAPAARVIAAAAALVLLPLMALAAQHDQAPEDWLDSPALQARLASGGVVVRSALDQHAARASVDAAIRVHAPPQAIWELITQCRYAPILIPGLKLCKQLSAAADGSWAVIEHDIKYAPLLPMVHSIFRADFQPPLRMDFHRIAGDLKDETGTWVLQPAADGTTTVEYRVSIKPGFWVPHAMIRRSLRKQLPAALVALRTHAEGLPPASVASAASVASTRSGSGEGAAPRATAEVQPITEENSGAAAAATPSVPGASRLPAAPSPHGT